MLGKILKEIFRNYNVLTCKFWRVKLNALQPKIFMIVENNSVAMKQLCALANEFAIDIRFTTDRQ